MGGGYVASICCGKRNCICGYCVCRLYRFGDPWPYVAKGLPARAGVVLCPAGMGNLGGAGPVLLGPAQRLPTWGAILGVIAGLGAAFVLNLPSRILGQAVPAALREVGVVVIVVFYFLLWMLVRAVYRALGPTDSAAPKSHTTAA
jgi:membrane associated rhomboid family serine protease